MPKQVRSARLVDAILQAAIRVLEREGAAAFTTIRVAEVAGVSVGSLYQYFPNKQSILMRLQEDEWQTTSQLLDGILTDESRDARTRLRDTMRAFFRSEYDEAHLRNALEAAAPLYHESSPAQAHRARGFPILRGVIAEAAPRLSAKRRTFATELYAATMTSLGKHVSTIARTPIEVATWADAVADMFLRTLDR